jgi:thymidylate synthase
MNELGYLQLMRKILAEGIRKNNRTGIPTLSLVGESLKFDLSQGFPLLTTKTVPWKAVVKELVWFIRGETDAKLLDAQGVKIWNANGSREFLDGRGLSYPEGELGPVYGWQWRKFGAEHPTTAADSDDEGMGGGDIGVDQLVNAEHLLKTDPDSRRIFVSAWNPLDLHKMALPPCHISYQFIVTGGALHCVTYQRSVDFALGAPFNVSSYAFLTAAMAAIHGFKPGTLTINMGDVHIYENHIEQCKEQLTRDIREPPTLELVNLPDSITKITLENFNIINYNPHPPIRMPMAV